MNHSIPMKPKKALGKAPGGFGWLSGLAGVVLGVIGSKLWADPSPHWLAGAPFQALSGWLIWKAFPERSSLPPAPEKPPAKGKKAPARPKPTPIPWLNFSLFIPMAGGVALGQFFFSRHEIAPALVSWALSLAVFGILLGRVPVQQRLSRLPYEKILLAAILLVAVLMRFPFIGQNITGLQIDEANCIEDAWAFIQGTLHSPFVTSWGANETFHFFFLSLFSRLFGESCATARAFSALISIGALYFFYRWCRFFFSPAASLLSTFLISAGWWYLFYSLSPFQDILVAFWEILSFYFLTKALKGGRKSDYWWAGIFIGFSEMEYLPGRLVVLMAGLAAAGILVVEGKAFWRNHAKYLLMTVLSMLWLAGPFIFYAFHDSSEILGRSEELSLLNDVHRTGNLGLIPLRIGWTLLSFVHHNTGADPRFCAPGPQLDPLCGALLVFGLVLALTHLRNRVSWLALSGFAFGIVANAFAIQCPGCDYSYINGQRYFLIVPFLFLMVAWALEWLFGFFSSFPSGWKKAGTVALSLLVAAAFLWNVQAYYFSFRNTKGGDAYWSALGFNHINVAEFLLANGSRFREIVDPQYDDSPTRVLTHNRLSVGEVTNDFKIPIMEKVKRDVLIVLLPQNYPQLQSRIRQVYPKAVWSPLKSPFGRDAITVEISKEDIQALQKGKKTGSELP